MITFLGLIFLRFIYLLKLHPRFPHIPLLAMISFISGLLPVTAGWMRWKSNSAELKLLCVLFTSFIIYLIVTLFLISLGKNTVWLAQLYSLAEYTVYVLVFVAWTKNGWIQSVFRASIYFYIVVWVAAKFTIEQITLYDTFTGPLRALLLTVMGMYTFVSLLKEENFSLIRSSAFWFATAVCLYSLGTLPIFVMANQLLTHSLEEFTKIWSINWIMTTISNTLYVLVFLYYRPLESSVAIENN